MPTYVFKHPNGKTVKINGDTPPDEATIDRIFAEVGGKQQPLGNDPAAYPQGKTTSEAEQMRREFLRNQGTLGTRLQNTPVKEMAVNAVKEPFRLAQEVATVPINSLINLGRTLKGKMAGDEQYADSRAAAESMHIKGPLEPSMTGEVIGTGIEKLKEMGVPAPAVDATMDILGLVGGTKAAVKGAGSLANLGRAAVDKTGVPKVLPTAEKLYASALKQSTNIPMEQRAANVKTGLEGSYVPNKKGLNRLYDNIGELNNQISTAISDSTMSGGKVSVDSIISRLDDVKQRAIDSFGDNNNVLAKIDDFAMSLQSHPEVINGEIPINTAQKMKVNTYKQLKNAYGELKGFEVEAKKAMARGAKEEIVAQIPELAGLNAKDSALINLEKVLFKAVNRIENRDLMGIGLPIKVAAGAMGGPKGAIIGAISGLIDTPAIKANLAIALHKARRRTNQPSTMPQAKLDAAAILQTIAAQRGEQTQEQP